MLGSIREATVRVAGIQLDVIWEDPAANLARVEPRVAEAAAAGARLVALPEMFATGFSMASVEMAAHAEAIRSAVAALARANGRRAAVPRQELPKCNRSFRNSACIVCWR